MEDTNFNINNNECIKERTVWGGTEYVNICTQESTVVTWGVDVYLCGVFVILAVFALIIAEIWIIKD